MFPIREPVPLDSTHIYPYISRSLLEDARIRKNGDRLLLPLAAAADLRSKCEEEENGS